MFNIQNIIQGFTVGGLIKLMVLAGLIMYSAFAAVLVVQVKVMTETLESDANPVVKAMAILHLLGALLLVAAGIIVL